MSKRSGDFFHLKKLLNEVNKDSIRFMMLYRSNDVELEFDLKKFWKKIKITQFLCTVLLCKNKFHI